MNRRTFLASSSCTLVAAALHELPAFGFGQAPAATPRFEDLRRGVGVFTMRGGTIGYLATKDAWSSSTASIPTPRRRASTG